MHQPLYVFLGPTGSGKTTQASRIADRYELDKITTGDIVRERIAHGEMDEEVIQSFNDGLFVYTDAISGLVNGAVRDRIDHGLVLDGYPRTESQYSNFDSVLHEAGRLITAVVYTDIDKEVARTRVLGRNRSDDSEESFENRFGQFMTHTVPLLGKLGADGNLIQVDGTRSIDELTEAISEKLDSL
jgi:adenylate kinase